MRPGPGLSGARRGRQLPVILLAVAALLWAAKGAVAAPVWQSQAEGRIEGIATISRQLTHTRTRVRVYEEPGTPPSAPVADENPLGNVVMYLESTGPIGGHGPSHAAPAMRQNGERFLPHVLPVVVGTLVELPNDDPIYHNVFSLSRVRAFDLGRYPRGSSKAVRFDSPGVVQVFCHIHADMSGYVLVLNNPFFVTPDAHGHFVLDGVPPGDYRLIAWHERIRPMVTPIHVAAGQTTTVRLNIPLPDTAPSP